MKKKLEFLILTFLTLILTNKLFSQPTGNGLIDETEFLHWIARIQALRDTEPAPEDDDLAQDLVAAFRCVKI